MSIQIPSTGCNTTIFRRRCGLTLVELIVVMLILIALAGILVPLLSTTSINAQDTATRATMKALRDAVIAYYQDMKGIPAWTPNGSAVPPGATGIPLTLRDLQIPPQDPTDPKGIRTVPAFDPVTGRGWRGPYVLQSTGSFLPEAPPGTPASPGTSLDVSFYPQATGYPSFPNASPPYTLSYLFGNPPPNPNPLKFPGDLAFLDGWGNPIVLQWPQTNDPLWVRLVSAGAPSNVNGYMVSTIDTLNVPQPLPSQRGNDYVLFILSQDPYP
jgi:type II secretory pathway pseudopilin PulG